MAPGISYDDSGSLASYFGVTFLAFTLIPFTYTVLRPATKDSNYPLCPCPECHNSKARLAKLSSSDQSRRWFRRIIPLGALWLLFFYLCYNLYTTPKIPGGTVYNPFEILGLSDSSTEKQIKKHFKKLSLQFHPDKLKLSENQTKEDAESKFVDLTKAYKSLTDEVTRENLAKYGNPDGPQQREDKIAIPQWVVEGKNSAWVLGAYGLVLGVAIPWIVGRWWFFQRRLTRDGILNPTAESFFLHLREETDFSSLISIIASAVELQPILAGKKKLSKKERKERQSKVEELEKVVDARRTELLVDDNPTIKRDDRISITNAAARRARALLWCHLLRVTPEDDEMKCETDELLVSLPTLLHPLVNIAVARGWLKTSLLCILLQPSLVQAVPNSVSPLAQLPGITPDAAMEMEITKKADGRRWLENWMKDVDQGSEDAAEVAKAWLRLEVTEVRFHIPGERIITPGSIVQLSWRCRYIHPSTSTTTSSAVKKILPNGDSHKEKSGDDVEGNGDAATVASVSEIDEAVDVVEGESGDEKNEKASDTKFSEKEKYSEESGAREPPAGEPRIGTDGKTDETPEYLPNGFAHAPRWPLLRKPQFYVLLGDSKTDKVIVPPIRVTDIPLPRTDGLPSKSREFSLQFQVPPQANTFSFIAHFCSDTFLGADVAIPVRLRVEEPADEEDDDDDDDISDPEEDSLAGQMAKMRGGEVKTSAVHGDAESEYDTSSDEEGPRKGKAINEDSSDSDSD